LEDSRQIQKKHTFRWLKGFANNFKGHKTMAYGILEIQISHSMHIQMQIGQEAWMTKKALVVVHSLCVPD